MAKRPGKELAPEENEPEVKLSVEIPVYLHRHLKAVAAQRGEKVKEVLAQLIDTLELEAPSKRRRKK